MLGLFKNYPSECEVVFHCDLELHFLMTSEAEHISMGLLAI
jgi:hypothetical protein